MRNLFLSIALLVCVVASAQEAGTIRGQMELIDRIYEVNFVYEASLPVNAPAPATVNGRQGLRQNLTALFRGTGISWTINRDYVILKRNNVLNRKKGKTEVSPVLPQYDTLLASFKMDTLRAHYTNVKGGTGIFGAEVNSKLYWSCGVWIY